DNGDHVINGRSVARDAAAEDHKGGNAVRYIRVTRKRVNVSDLEPFREYEVTITAATTSDISKASEAVRAITMEGVPSAPSNISWQPKSTKEVCLSWQRPSNVNGNLMYYHLSYSHDDLIWNNLTIDSHSTETMLKGLVSNTNYSVQLVGVTAAGEGEPATTHVYIQAILKMEPQQPSTYFVVICVLSVLAALISLLMLLHCCRLLRQHRCTSSQAYQGVGSCQLVHVNGNASKGLSSDCRQGANGLDLGDYTPMLTSLHPHTTPRHLDTKGDVTIDGPLRDNIFRPPLDNLDDIDAEDDVTRKLLPIVLNSEDSSPQSLEDEDLHPLHNQHQLNRCNPQPQKHPPEYFKSDLQAQSQPIESKDMTSSLSHRKELVPNAKTSKILSAGPPGIARDELYVEEDESIAVGAT
ncbi:unnamed protein product, partial [Meganyctiphanes norvegica]